MEAIKRRVEEKSNYSAIWCNGKTIRIALDSTKPITELEYPEFYDVSITNKCPGNCEYCYQDSKENISHSENIVEKVESFFGSMTENQRPFQVAIGGGEPTLHPDFKKVLKTFYDLNICPNFTTNGMFLDLSTEAQDILIETVKEYCGGVAVSCHAHLDKYWRSAAELFHKNNIRLNFHIIISDKESCDRFEKIYNEWEDKVDYFVLLPYSAVGRAEEKPLEWEYLLTKLPEDKKKIAFGANFYPFLQKHTELGVMLYEPEIMSKYIALEGSGKMYNSSFSKTPIKVDLFTELNK